MALLSFTPVNIQLVSSLALLLSILLQVAVPLVEAKDVVPFKQNLDMVFREWSCNQPKPRLVYLGKYQLAFQSWWDSRQVY